MQHNLLNIYLPYYISQVDKHIIQIDINSSKVQILLNQWPDDIQKSILIFLGHAEILWEDD